MPGFPPEDVISFAEALGINVHRLRELDIHLSRDVATVDASMLLWNAEGKPYVGDDPNTAAHILRRYRLEVMDDLCMVPDCTATGEVVLLVFGTRVGRLCPEHNQAVVEGLLGDYGVETR